MMYTLKFDFSTIKVVRGGSIRGCTNGGECVITTEYPLDELKTKTDELKSIAYSSLIDNPKLKNLGSINSIDIIDVVPH